MNKTVTVYFSGTGFSLVEGNFLTSSLHTRTKINESQIKMGFNGCAVDYGVNGLLFGSGLDAQCEKVIQRVIQEINAGHQITLNVYGHSRGGIAALLLAKQLGNINKEMLAINLALLDPVPGNYITTSSIDPFKLSLANKTMDLSDCQPLRKVLALYPHKPIPAIACHAPLLVSYPKETEVEEEVVNGCHAETENIFTPASKLVRLRVEEFLIQNGTELVTHRDYKDTEVMKQTYLKRYQKELAYVTKPLTREVHSARGLIITATPGAKYLNSRHKELVGDNSQEPVSLSIQPEKGLVSGFKRFFTHHPLVGQALKWTLISLATSSLFYFTGGLAAIPLLAPIVVKLLVFSPVFGAAVAALWYGVAKPILSWSTQKFVYSHYAMRKIETPDSTLGFIDALGVRSSTNSSMIESIPYQAKSPLHSTQKMVKKDLPHENDQERSFSFS